MSQSFRSLKTRPLFSFPDIWRESGKNRTFLKRLDLLPSKLPCLVEQQWERSPTICDSSHGRLFVCHYIARMERMG